MTHTSLPTHLKLAPQSNIFHTVILWVSGWAKKSTAYNAPFCEIHLPSSDWTFKLIFPFTYTQTSQSLKKNPQNPSWRVFAALAAFHQQAGLMCTNTRFYILITRQHNTTSLNFAEGRLQIMLIKHLRSSTVNVRCLQINIFVPCWLKLKWSHI